VSARRLLWYLAALVLVVSAVLLYSPRLGRHSPPLDRLAAALFVLGWAVAATVRLD
jgi:hypothetical protein